MTIVEKLEKQIEELRAEVERLKNKEELERTEHYFFIDIDYNGDFFLNVKDDGMTTKKYDNWNYFRTEESGGYFSSAINELKKLQHYHEIYCPDYVPNWNNEDEKKFGMVFNKLEHKYQYMSVVGCYKLNDIYFDSRETAEKVCNRMNETL